MACTMVDVAFFASLVSGNTNALSYIKVALVTDCWGLVIVVSDMEWAASI